MMKTDCVVTPAASTAEFTFLGHLHLVAERDAGEGRTTIARQSFRAPFHLGKPYWDGAVLQTQIVNSTAGILAGDSLELDIAVDERASLLVTTPAATRAFMMQRGVAECRQSLAVAPRGWLEYAPEPLCPHRETSYAQTTRLDVADGGEAFYVDALAPGRVARGETWAWRRLQLALDVRHAGEPVLRERLDGSGAAMAHLASRYGTPAGWFGTIVAISPHLANADDHDGPWASVRALHRGGKGLWVGASRLRHGGWIVRVIAPDGQAWRAALCEIRGLLASRLPRLGSDLRKL